MPFKRIQGEDGDSFSMILVGFFLMLLFIFVITFSLALNFSSQIKKIKSDIDVYRDSISKLQSDVEFNASAISEFTFGGSQSGRPQFRSTNTDELGNAIPSAITHVTTTGGVYIYGGATTTHLGITTITSECLETDANGTVIGSGSACGTGSGGGGNWLVIPGQSVIYPSTTVGIIVSASSTFIGNFKIDGNATTTGGLVLGNSVHPRHVMLPGDIYTTGGITSTDSLILGLDNFNCINIDCAGGDLGVQDGAQFNGLVYFRNTVTFVGERLISGSGVLDITASRLDINSGLVMGENATTTLNFAFLGELMPDGAECANGEILKKTGANDWDCASDSEGSGAYSWTPTDHYGLNTSATGTPLWIQGTTFDLFASSTAVFTYASATAVSITESLDLNGAVILNHYGTACTGNEWLQDIADDGTFSCGALDTSGSWTGDAGSVDGFEGTDLFAVAGDTMANGTSTDSFQAAKFTTDGSVYISDFVGDGFVMSGTTLIFDCSDVASTGLQCSGEDLQLNATGDWTGTLDGYEGVELVDLRPTTTSFNGTTLVMDSPIYTQTTTQASFYVGGDFYVEDDATTTGFLTLLQYQDCTLKTDGSGVVICGSDNTGSGGDDAFTHTAVWGQVTSATSTLLSLTGSPVSLAASGTIQFTNASGTAITVSSIHIGGDALNELVGDGLDNSSGALIFDCSEVASTGLQCSGEDLQLNATGDWTGTLDGFEAVDLNNLVFVQTVAFGLTTSATSSPVLLNTTGAFSLLASSTSVFDYASATAASISQSLDLNGASILNHYGTACSGNEWLQDIADDGTFSCGSLDVTGAWTGTFDGQEGSYYLDYANHTNKDWVDNGVYLRPSSTVRGLIVNASSTFNGNLKIGGAATSTGNFWVGNTSNGFLFDTDDWRLKFFGSAKPTSTIILTSGGATPTINDSGNATTTQTTVKYTNNHQTFVHLDYPDSTDNTAQWLVQMPANYDGGSVLATVYNTATSTTGNVKWCIRALSYANSDALDGTWGSYSCWGGQVVATANDIIVSSSTSMTIGGTPAANETVLFEVQRDTSEDSRADFGRILQIKLDYHVDQLDY